MKTLKLMIIVAALCITAGDAFGVTGTTSEMGWSLSTSGDLIVTGRTSFTHSISPSHWSPYNGTGHIPARPGWLSYGPSIRSVVIGEGICEIGYDAFNSCTALNYVSLPSTISRIGERTFAGCSELTSIVLPQRLSYIGEKAFYQCSSLANISISGYNPEANSGSKAQPIFSVFNGLLYLDNTYMSANVDRYYTLYVCPEALITKNITLRSGTTCIAKGAFSDCKNIESIVVPEGVTTIEEDVFNGCSNLKTIALPKSVTKIGNNAFKGCSSITSVTMPACISSLSSTFPSYLHKRLSRNP